MNIDPIARLKDTLVKYDDYRDFLKDYFALQKRLRSSFTQRYFARKAGIASHTFCNYVINGKRNLSEKTLEKFVQTLEFSGVHEEYFKTLVYFNQSVEQSDKERYFKKLTKIKKEQKFEPVKQKQSVFYEKHYHAVIRELAAFNNWNGSFKTLGSMVRPSISAHEAKEAVKNLVDCGLLLEKDGKYQQNSENINDSKVPVFLKKKTRNEVFQRGIEVLEQISPQERYSVYSTMLTNREGYDKIVDLFNKFRKDMNKVVDETKGEDEVFQMTFGLFPVSKKINK